MSKYHAVVYHTPNCVKCKMTVQSLQTAMRVKVEYLFHDNDEWSERKIQKFRDQGYSSFPVVRVYETATGRRMADWCDLNMPEVTKWKKKAQED